MRCALLTNLVIITQLADELTTHCAVYMHSSVWFRYMTDSNTIAGLQKKTVNRQTVVQQQQYAVDEDLQYAISGLRRRSAPIAW